MSLQDIREGLAANLSTIRGLRTSFFVPDNPSPPIVLITPQRVEYDSSFNRGVDEYTFEVRLLAARSSDRGGQRILDSYCAKSGATSIKAAIESDKTLGGVVDSVRVTDWSDYGSIQVGEVVYLTVAFNVVAMA